MVLLGIISEQILCSQTCVPHPSILLNSWVAISWKINSMLTLKSSDFISSFFKVLTLSLYFTVVTKFYSHNADL